MITRTPLVKASIARSAAAVWCLGFSPSVMAHDVYSYGMIHTHVQA